MLLNPCILAPLNFLPPQEHGKGEIDGNTHELHRFTDTSRAAKKWERGGVARRMQEGEMRESSIGP